MCVLIVLTTNDTYNYSCIVTFLPCYCHKTTGECCGWGSHGMVGVAKLLELHLVEAKQLPDRCFSCLLLM